MPQFGQGLFNPKKRAFDSIRPSTPEFLKKIRQDSKRDEVDQLLDNLLDDFFDKNALPPTLKPRDVVSATFASYVDKQPSNTLLPWVRKLVSTVAHLYKIYGQLFCIGFG